MRFSYVQIGCQDIEKLTSFYERVLDFKKTDDKSWLKGKEGVVYEAPGFKDQKVYFGFIKSNKGSSRAINDRGYAHIAFETVDVRSAVNRLVKYGGSFQSTLEDPANKPCVYCKDPEGNIVEFHIPFPSKDASAFETVACLLHLKKDKGIINETGKSTIKFIHVNIITEDWRKLCDFYNDVVGSEDTGKIKDHSGDFKEAVIGVKGVHVLGKHVLLPGYFKSYPTIEIFNYSIKGLNTPVEEDALGINLTGYVSDDLDNDIRTFEEHGGKFIRKIDESSVLISDYQGDLILLQK